MQDHPFRWTDVEIPPTISVYLLSVKLANVQELRIVQTNVAQPFSQPPLISQLHVRIKLLH